MTVVNLKMRWSNLHMEIIMAIHFECKLNPENVILNVDFC